MPFIYKHVASCSEAIIALPLPFKISLVASHFKAERRIRTEKKLFQAMNFTPKYPMQVKAIFIKSIFLDVERHRNLAIAIPVNQYFTPPTTRNEAKSTAPQHMYHSQAVFRNETDCFSLPGFFRLA